jgi:hypothetical protein
LELEFRHRGRETEAMPSTTNPQNTG